MKKLSLALLFLLCTSVYAECDLHRDKYGHIYRSKKVLSQFRATVPCPGTGKTEKRCAGYVIDHVKALSCACTEEQRSALDSVGNLQWQTIAEGKAKDKIERKMCGAAD